MHPDFQKQKITPSFNRIIINAIIIPTTPIILSRLQNELEE